ncbi:hypothetical protein T4A_4948 [Trichinella pseudospiralis]|uniref:Uncharacterized protein n=1 Tax=Trichinella pseudospiralis TaxID=6337 RepID=A0A0V1DQE9_TRIPS|nr:hypothetical protein T4A_4948 [Trichinella pseudospiralis]
MAESLPHDDNVTNAKMLTEEMMVIINVEKSVMLLSEQYDAAMIIGVVFYFQLSSDIIRLIAFNTNEEGEKSSSKSNDSQP